MMNLHLQVFILLLFAFFIHNSPFIVWHCSSPSMSELIPLSPGYGFAIKMEGRYLFIDGSLLPSLIQHLKISFGSSISASTGASILLLSKNEGDNK